MDVFEAIKGRRSIRVFKKDDVSHGNIEKLIDAARWAPSAGNIQPWEFITVRKLGLKRRLVKATLGQSFVEEAPVVIVVCANEDLSSEGYGARGKTLYCIQDTAAAIQNILLAAYSIGLGACWIGAFDEEEAREILRVPAGIRPVAIIPVGYPGETASRPIKRPMDQFVHRETF